MEASQTDGAQTDEAQNGDEHVVQGHSGLDSLTRAEQQPQEVGHSSAPPPSAQSGIGASGIPDNPGAEGGPTPGQPAEGGDSPA